MAAMAAAGKSLVGENTFEEGGVAKDMPTASSGSGNFHAYRRRGSVAYALQAGPGALTLSAPVCCVLDAGRLACRELHQPRSCNRVQQVGGNHVAPSASKGQ